jgi:hypothetical protein
VRKSITDKIKGVDKLFVVGEDTNTENNITTENNNSTDDSNTIISSTSHSTNTNTVIPKEKVKYVDVKTQRAYWLDTELVKIFDKCYPTKKYDKSEIINELLRKFLIENGKL